MNTALVIHGHFYQPPRENPWTTTIDREPSAAPFHDWNERIYRECYRPNAYARIFDDAGKVSRIINNYALISFNFGPTLLSWLARQHPLAYARILEADRQSAARRGGHGNALAQAYNHTILPLCSPRDRRTQVRWGITDFRWRFGRLPEGLWLPECAADDDTLGVLIEEGLSFVILSPFQAERVRALAGKEWQSARDGHIDTSVAYRYFHRDGSKRAINVLFYGSAPSKAIAFEGALRSSHTLLAAFNNGHGGPGRVSSAATDGESYGHHFKWGERCLAHALEVEAERKGFWLTNYAEYLERHPPQHEVELASGAEGLGTSWSCAHGVGRWMRDCGCQTGGEEGWNQRWRGPLRSALDVVRDQAAHWFEALGEELFRDPWAARDASLELQLDPRAEQPFFQAHARHALSTAERERALTLLDMQRQAQLMYTSCGWFFNDISGIETVQVLRYAARVLEYFDELELASPRGRMLEILAEARSNRVEAGSGADVYRRQVESARVTPKRVAAHLAMTSLAEPFGRGSRPEQKASAPTNGEGRGEVARFRYRLRAQDRRRDGRMSVATARVELQDLITGKASEHVVAAFHFGGVDFFSVARPFAGAIHFDAACRRLWEHFASAPLPVLLRIASEEFGPEEFHLEHLLADARVRINQLVFAELVQSFAETYRRLYEENRRTLEMLQTAGSALPKELRAAAEFTLGRQFEEEVERQAASADPAAYRRALAIAHEAAEHGYEIDKSVSSHTFEDMLNARVLAAATTQSAEDLEAALALLDLVRRLGLPVNLEPAQETVYASLREEVGARALAPLAERLGLVL